MPALQDSNKNDPRVTEKDKRKHLDVQDKKTFCPQIIADKAFS